MWAVRMEGTTDVNHYKGYSTANNVAEDLARMFPRMNVHLWDVDESERGRAHGSYFVLRAGRDGIARERR